VQRLKTSDARGVSPIYGATELLALGPPLPGRRRLGRCPRRYLPRRSLQRSIASAPHDVLHFLRRCVSERCYHREASGVSRRFVNELHARGQAEFGVDVGEVGLYGAR
jgi:hypothetical protein